MDETLSVYIAELSTDRFKPLTAAQERALLKDWPSEDCKRKLIEHNLRFSVSLAKKYRGSGVPLEDLVCAANQGLCTAVGRFEPKRGFKFISYAVWWMRQTIFMTIAGDRTVRLPANMEESVRDIEQFVTKFYQDNGRFPTGDEVDESSELTKRQYDNVQKYCRPVWSLDKALDSNIDEPLKGLVADNTSPSPESMVEDLQMREEIKKMFDNRLTDQEKDIVLRYYGFGDRKSETLHVIADSYNLTRERIRQIRDRALMKLKHPSNKVIFELQ